MTPEERSLLERTYKLSEENNSILRSIRRANRWSVAFKVAYWLVIIGLSVGALYFIKPYVEFMKSAFGATGNSTTTSESSSQNFLQNFQDLIK